MTATAMADFLVTYLATRKRERDERIAKTFAKLTKREQRLVKEAAVMGYVQGVRAEGQHDAVIPKDSVVLATVIGACLALPDLYPAMDRVAKRAGAA